MKKILPLIVLVLVTVACTIGFPSSSSFDQDVAAGVGVAFTQTAMQATTDAQQVTTAPESAPEPTATQTPPADDPKSVLGNPDWQDSLTNGSNWSLDQGPVEIDNTTFSQGNGKLTAVSQSTTGGIRWWLIYKTYKDAYLEATFEVENCSGNDQYGLVVRAPDYESGLGYYYTVTCDGQYDLLRSDNSGTDFLLGFPSSDAINKGSNQTNTLGIWTKGSIVRLYINNHFLTEIENNTLTAEGHFGLFINAKQTAGFTIHMDDISYWLLD
jgi:type II secretory pathway pseudopilin PulG